MKRILTVLPLLLISTFILRAEDNVFYRVLDELVKDCPEIQVIKAANLASIETERAVNRIASPEVEVEQVWGRHGVGNKFDVGVSQSFDWPGLYRQRAKMIDAQSNANLLMEQSSLLEKTLQVKLLMVDIIFQKKNLHLANMMNDHAIQLEKATKEAYERGEISKLEFKRTELERIQTSIQLREAQRILDEMYAELTSATGKENCVSLMAQISDVPSWGIKSEEEYEDILKQMDPRMRYLQATIQAIEETGKSEKMATGYPVFSVGYVYQREQWETFNGFNVSMSLPIYGTSNVRRASKANVIAAQLEAQAEQISLLSKMRNQRNAALSLAHELNDYSSIFEDGNYSQLLKLALEGGETDNIHYLQELNFYVEVTRQYIELQHQYNLSLVNLNRHDLTDSVVAAQ